MQVVFDIDGTLADLGHRLKHIAQAPKDWIAFNDACEADTPHPHMMQVMLAIGQHHNVILATGRPESTRNRTIAWLQRHGPRFWDWPTRRLLMRPDGHHIPDDRLKENWLLDGRFGKREDILCAFEDRQRVVDMWRKWGIPCMQVAPGDF